MLQFYFLSILLNLLAGLIFVYAAGGDTEMILSDSDDPLAQEDFSEKTASNTENDFDPETDDLDLNLDGGSSAEKTDDGKKAARGGFKTLAVSFLGDKTLQLVVGILSLLTGLMKLLSPIQYDIPVVGDLIPAVAGIVAGAILLLDWYQERSEVDLSLPGPLQVLYAEGRKYVGIFCLISAVLHFIFPRAMIL